MNKIYLVTITLVVLVLVIMTLIPDCNMNPFCDNFIASDQTTTLEIIFGKPYENKLLPVTIRESTTHASNLEKIPVWNFEFVKNTEETLRFEYWDIIPEDDVRFTVSNEDFTSIIDESKEFIMPNIAMAFESPIDCSDSGLQRIITGVPYDIPIYTGNDDVFVDHTTFGIFPDENDVYSFSMASFFDIRNGSYDYLEILSEEYEECDWVYGIHEHLDPDYPVKPTFVEWKFKLK